MKNTLATCLAVIMNLNILAQDISSHSTMREVVYITRKEINALNLKFNGSKQENFNSKVDADIFKLKRLFDSSASTFSNTNESNVLFKESLRQNLNALRSWKGDNQTILDLIEDYETKSNSFRFGLSKNDTPLIEVIVTTYDSMLNKIDGYYVYWNFWIDKNNQKPYSKFDQFTSPTSQGLLTSGVYDIWVQKANEVIRYPAPESRTRTFVSARDTSLTKRIDIIVK